MGSIDHGFFLLELSKKEIDVVTVPDKSSMLVGVSTLFVL